VRPQDRPARAVWNQHAYDITNINDDLSVPTDPVPGFADHNTWHSAQPSDLGAIGEDLSGEILAVCQDECADGTVFTGCNVENLSFGLTMCAERVAIGAAVVAGHRDFRCIAIVADTDSPISPCGACRQVMAEFHPSLKILSATLDGKTEEFTLDQLLPRASTGILNRP
jgi:cytidine deaminase